MKKRIIILLFLICQLNLLFGQKNHSRKIDSVFLSKIPFDSLMAINDIKQGNIRILRLQSDYQFPGSPVNTNEELKYIEDRFGFKFYYENFQVSYQYILRKQDEYNNQVFKYLDSILKIDTKNAINDELLRLFFERRIVSNETDKKIKKRIQKNLRKENKGIKLQIVGAEMIYRNREFQESLKIYQKLLDQVETTETKKFLLTSIYHCYLNLDRFDDASTVLKTYESDWINTKIKRLRK